MTSQNLNFLSTSLNYKNTICDSEFEKDDFSIFDSSNIVNKSPFFGNKINNYIYFLMKKLKKKKMIILIIQKKKKILLNFKIILKIPKK